MNRHVTSCRSWTSAPLWTSVPLREQSHEKSWPNSDPGRSGYRGVRTGEFALHGQRSRAGDHHPVRKADRRSRDHCGPEGQDTLRPDCQCDRQANSRVGWQSVGYADQRQALHLCRPLRAVADYGSPPVLSAPARWAQRSVSPRRYPGERDSQRCCQAWTDRDYPHHEGSRAVTWRPSDRSGTAAGNGVVGADPEGTRNRRAGDLQGGCREDPGVWYRFARYPIQADQLQWERAAEDLRSNDQRAAADRGTISVGR